MIDGVANQVGQRILDGLKNGLIELRILALHLHLDPFAARQSQIAHHARKFSPDVFDWLHAGFHHAFLQLGRDQAQTLGRVQKG